MWGLSEAFLRQVALQNEIAEEAKMPDYRQRVQDSQGGFRKLLGRLPGFKGYMAKESRREADKMLRTYIGRKLEQQRARLQQLGGKLATAGDMDAVTSLEQVRMRLQTISDKIKTATYGYAGFFDAATVNEKELDALYDFDNSLLDQAEAITTAVGAVSTAAKGDAFNEALDKAGMAIDDLNAVWVKRQDVVTGGATQ
jgi:hypothetical protein